MSYENSEDGLVETALSKAEKKHIPITMEDAKMGADGYRVRIKQKMLRRYYF